MEAIKPIVDRDPQFIDTDRSALQALCQAAVNVELFTIPLYMTTLYSIQGMHEINAADQTFYRGRRWPGAATKSLPRNANERAFNAIFSVFIQEMLHLQLAANLAASMGVTPSFTNPMLQTKDFGWTCYSPTNTVIPHIIDLRDTTIYDDIKVTLGPLDHNQIELFLAIEEPEDLAYRRIDRDKRHKYFPAVPFADWAPEKGEATLPLFGTIGHMYDCMTAYMLICYSDGTSLWEKVYTPRAVQRELFNTPTGGHPMPEYPGFSTLVPTASAAEGLRAAVDIISAITDQGEGGTISAQLRDRLVGNAPGRPWDVEADYRSSRKALRLDYPSYDADGKLIVSADAAARFANDGKDHFSRFREIKRELKSVVTWADWHKDNHRWTEKDLLTGDALDPESKIPSAAEIADALNRLKDKNVDGSVRKQLSQVAAGAIAGVTRVLDKHWRDSSVGFPFPSMGGSGDRMAICWAVLGEGPDLSLGIEQGKEGVLHHACQGLDLDKPGSGEMPAISTYHTCKGSNDCKGQGGCGFVQSIKGGGNCSGGAGGGCGMTVKAQVGCKSETLYGAPSDNKCGGFGGCAVPISASQLYPTSGQMQLFDIKPGEASKELGELSFAYGEVVHDVAWKAYCEVLKARGQTPPSEPPPPSDLRLAFPPST